MSKSLFVIPAVLLSVWACAASGPKNGNPASSVTAESSAAPTAETSALGPSPAASASAVLSTGPTVERVAATLKGKLAGKDFEASSACVAGSTKPGRVYIEIYDAKGDAKERCGMLRADTGALKH